MHRDKSLDSLTVKDEASTELNPPTLMMKSPPKKRGFLFALIIGSLVVILLAGIPGFIFYQNHVNETNAYNAYLSSLSGNGTLVFSDPLSGESGSQWGPSTGNSGTCLFTRGSYHLKQQSDSFIICNAPLTYSNFAFEVQLSIVQGGCGGIVFRESTDGAGMFYYFSICQIGSYDITRYANYGGFQPLPSGTSSAIHTGLNQQNTIAVRAIDGAMTFYINEQQIAQAHDDVYTQGNIGLAAYPSGLTDLSEIAYTNARLWTF